MPDWMTWSPFQSKQTKEICAHMTAAERRKAAGMAALFGFVFSIVLQSPIYFQMAGLLSTTRMWILCGLLFIVLFASIPFVQRWSRSFLCNTEWARTHGIKPESLALYDFRFGMKHLLALMTAVAVIAAIVWNVRAR